MVCNITTDGKLNINATTHNFKNQNLPSTFHNNGSVSASLKAL